MMNLKSVFFVAHFLALSTAVRQLPDSGELLVAGPPQRTSDLAQDLAVEAISKFSEAISKHPIESSKTGGLSPLHLQGVSSAEVSSSQFQTPGRQPSLHISKTSQPQSALNISRDSKKADLPNHDANVSEDIQVSLAVLTALQRMGQAYAEQVQLLVHRHLPVGWQLRHVPVTNGPEDQENTWITLLLSILAQLATPLAIVFVLVAKFAIDLVPKDDAGVKYNYGVAVGLNSSMVGVSFVGICGISAILVSYGVHTDQPANRGSILLVLIVFLPQMVACFFSSLLKLTQLLSVRKLVGRQMRLYQRIEESYVDLQGGYYGEFNSQAAYYRIRIMQFLHEVLGRQERFVKNFHMSFVSAQLLLSDVHKSLLQGRRQLEQWWTRSSPNKLSALITGYWELCVWRLVDDMYAKQGGSRQGVSQCIGRQLVRYKPVASLLAFKQVPYESLTLLRRVLRTMGVCVWDFDVRYTAHCLQYIYEVMGEPFSPDNEDSYKSSQQSWHNRRYGPGHTSFQIRWRAMCKGYKAGAPLSATPKWYRDLVRIVPGASRSALDYLVRIESNWAPEDQQWQYFKSVALSRHRVSGISAKFTPAGRELSKVVAGGALMDRERQLHDGESSKTAIAAQQPVKEAVALADLLYWATETRVLMGNTERRYVRQQSVRKFYYRNSGTHGWLLQDDDGVGLGYTIAQDTICSRLMMLPTHALLGRIQEDTPDYYGTMEERQATAAVQRMLGALELAFDAVADVRKAMRAVQESTLQLSEQLRESSTPDQEPMDTIIADLGRLDELFNYPVQDAELQWSSVKAKLSAKSKLMETTSYTFDDINTERDTMQRMSAHLKKTMVRVVKVAQTKVVPDVHELLRDPATVWAQHDHCQVLLWNFDFLFDSLYQANRRSWQAKHVVDLVCLSAKDTESHISRQELSGGKDEVLGPLSGLVTCLLVESRMALVAMLLMSGLWPRLLAARVVDEEGVPIPKKLWNMEEWQLHLLELLDEQVPTSEPLHRRLTSTDTGLLRLGEYAESSASLPPDIPDTAQRGPGGDQSVDGQLDPFTGHALTKLLDHYQVLLVDIARECYSKELWQSGGTYELVQALDNQSLRAAIVASVIGGFELSRDFLKESKRSKHGVWDWLRAMQGARWKDSSDPLRALQNFERFPSVRDDDLDSEDGWY